MVLEKSYELSSLFCWDLQSSSPLDCLDWRYYWWDYWNFFWCRFRMVAACRVWYCRMMIFCPVWSPFQTCILSRIPWRIYCRASIRSGDRIECFCKWPEDDFLFSEIQVTCCFFVLWQSALEQFYWREVLLKAGKKRVCFILSEIAELEVLFLQWYIGSSKKIWSSQSYRYHHRSWGHSIAFGCKKFKILPVHLANWFCPLGMFFFEVFSLLLIESLSEESKCLHLNRTKNNKSLYLDLGS